MFQCDWCGLLILCTSASGLVCLTLITIVFIFPPDSNFFLEDLETRDWIKTPKSLKWLKWLIEGRYLAIGYLSLWPTSLSPKWICNVDYFRPMITSLNHFFFSDTDISVSAIVRWNTRRLRIAHPNLFRNVHEWNWSGYISRPHLVEYPSSWANAKFSWCDY